MTNFHPDTKWLSEYAAGTLPDSQALCVSTHVAYCQKCKQEVSELTQLGALVFNTQSNDSESAPQLLQNILSHINKNPSQTDATSQQTSSQPVTGHTELPSAIKTLIPEGTDNLPWKKIGPRISIAKLNNLGDTRSVALHKLQPGSTVSDHDHHGLEITVVLDGSFSDKDGQYFPGDFLVREAGEVHSPCASNDEECLCLTVCDAPVRFTGFFTRLLNPLLAYQHKH